MKKTVVWKKLAAFILASAFVLNCALPTAFAQDSTEGTGAVLNLPCRNAILVNMDTGTVLYEQGADDEVPIASITKVMTLLLTLEAVEAGKVSMTDIVPISEHAYNMGGSQIWLEPGEQFTLDELIKAICVCSANDAAVAVAEFVGGSEPVFAEMMNAKAQELGMEHTHFVNACGLDAQGHYSSARDVSVMSMELLKHPKILEYCGIWMDSLRNGETQMVNTNKLLKSYPGITGLKTGTTNGAGVCISASAERDGMGLLAVVLGSPSSAERFDAATQLLDYGFANYETADFPAIAGQLQTLPVKGGVAQQVSLEYAVPEKILLKKGEGQTLTAEATLPSQLDAPVPQGEKVGEVTLRTDQTVLGTYPIVATGEVAKMDFSTAFSMLFRAIFTL
ncbi:D-alanyl-D-alanine carboxypeptidase family protein [uncultured Ruthenibacterium sp.]|uniref:D-alanyl-D-alanine carboxypeptidase family protein n=1 Tax=uncultured Ruthenibacterium sp. TaxID=1905347 RepID=UPI00349EB87C